MKYKELFTGENKLFANIFKDRYRTVYNEIFADTDPDTFALVKFGNREVIDNMNAENVTGYTGAILDMCVDTFKSRWEVFNKQYDFLKPVIGGTTTDKTVTLQELNTDGSVKSDKTFGDDDFLNDSKEDKTNDKERTEKETVTVSQTGFTGNVTRAMLDEYRARLLNVRDDIISDLVSYITLSIYS